MIRDFESWNNTLGEAALYEDLSGMRVGIEAAHYLHHRVLNHPRFREPLVPALGGLPLAFQTSIEEDLNKFNKYGIQPFFVFSGLDITRQEDPFRQRQDGATINREAWDMYDRHQAESSVARFGESSKEVGTHGTGKGTDICQHMSLQRTSSAGCRPSS